jgi:Uma2 family endonuclease
MVAPIVKPAREGPVLARLLRPDLLVDGAEPEQRIVYSNISWERYLAFDEKLGHDRPGPRLYYWAGQLEIMSTSEEHERLKEWLGDLMSDYFFEKGIEVIPRGQATMRLKNVGAEPDKSWCIGRKKKFPDLVIEIALSSGGINKLDIYAGLKIPEVWFWRAKHLEVFIFDRSKGGYEQSSRSRLLPDLDIASLERCLRLSSWREARRAFRATISG